MVIVRSPNRINRGLTLFGRILVINTPVSSLYVYKMMVLEYMTESQIKRFYRIITEYLWKDKDMRIPLKVLQMSKEARGQRLVNIEAKHKSLLSNWVFKLPNNMFFKVVTSSQLIPDLGQFL